MRLGVGVKTSMGAAFLLLTLGLALLVTSKFYVVNKEYSIAGTPTFADVVAVPFREHMRIESFSFSASLNGSSSYELLLANTDLIIGSIRVSGPGNYSIIMNSSFSFTAPTDGTYTFSVGGYYIASNELGLGDPTLYERVYPGLNPVAPPYPMGSGEPSAPERQTVNVHVFQLLETNNPSGLCQALALASYGLLVAGIAMLASVVALRVLIRR